MSQPVSDTRLIERWLPITEIGIESLRERTPMTPFPAPNRLHVWWARRPLVASRAAILASLLPADADHEKFRHILGIHGDPVKAKQAIENARRTGVRVKDPYGYPRAFAYNPDEQDWQWLASFGDRLKATILDPTAGGGAIPLEAVRLGLPVVANDLNPVASLLEYATVKWPTEFGMILKQRFLEIAQEWRKKIDSELTEFFPQKGAPNEIDITYLWARTVRCPYCEGLIPLSPNWRLAPGGTGVRLLPRCEKEPANRHCDFQIVAALSEQSIGTIAGGDATCPFSDCGRIVDGDEVKCQAQSQKMGQQLFAIVVKRRVITKTKTGKNKIGWVQEFRAPRSEDDTSEAVMARLKEKLSEWEALDVIPNEIIPEGLKTNEPIRYGITRWSEMFSPRQLLSHATAFATLREWMDASTTNTKRSALDSAACVYLALALDKMLNWNAILASWNVHAETMRSVFDRHDFAFTWSFGEMAVLTEGLGYDWAIEQTAKCIEELVEMARPHEDRNEGRS